MPGPSARDSARSRHLRAAPRSLVPPAFLRRAAAARGARSSGGAPGVPAGPGRAVPPAGGCRAAAEAAGPRSGTEPATHVRSGAGAAPLARRPPPRRPPAPHSPGRRGSASASSRTRAAPVRLRGRRRGARPEQGAETPPPCQGPAGRARHSQPRHANGRWAPRRARRCAPRRGAASARGRGAHPAEPLPDSRRWNAPRRAEAAGPGPPPAAPEARRPSPSRSPSRTAAAGCGPGPRAAARSPSWGPPRRAGGIPPPAPSSAARYHGAVKKAGPVTSEPSAAPAPRSRSARLLSSRARGLRS